MDRCPSREDLQRLLAEELIPARQQTIETHVEACAACQKTLASLSEGGEGLSTQLLRFSPPPRLEPSEMDFVRHLQEHPPTADETACLLPEQTLSPIIFPGPPSEKGPLGQLDGFAIRAELGAGRFGIVYQAYDELDRLVALKVLKPELAASTRERARFEHEARKAAAVDHDHIVTIHQVGHSANFPLPYLVMEYIDGEPLSDRLERHGVMEPREAARLVRQMALALAAAHARGLIHRDIKPSNILLEAGSGRAKLTDFGLARVTDSVGGSTSQSGRIVGTPAYMSPEQIASPHHVDGRSDIYSLGVVLYELLTGERPFRGATHLLLQQVVHDEPRPPRKLNDTIPRDLEVICLKAMSKPPSRRYASALDLAEDLYRFLAGEPIRARPISSVEKLCRWCRRNPAVAVLSAGVALLLVSVALVSALAALRLGEEQKLTVRQRDRAERAEREKSEKLWQSYLDQARARRSSREAGQRFASLEKLREAAIIVRSLDYEEEVLGRNILELRNEAIACMPLLDARPLRAWPVNFPAVVTFDAKLERFAHTDSQGNVTVRRVVDDAEILRLSGTETPPVYTGCRFSPDGKYLATHYYLGKQGSRFILRDLGTYKKLLEIPSWLTSESFDFSVDSRRLAVAGADESIALYDCASGKKLKSFGRDLKPAQIAFDPSGRKLAVSSTYLPIVQIWDIEGVDVLATLPHPLQTLGVAWNPEGRVAVSCLDAKIYLWDLAQRQQPTILEGHQANITRLAFNHAGNLLFSRSDDGTTRLWDPISAKHLLTIPALCDRISLDDKLLSTRQADGIRVWELAGHGALVMMPGAATALDFSPDGALLATAGADGVRLWDVSTARRVADLRLDQCETAIFHPNGRSLVTYGKASGLLLWPLQDEMQAAIQVRRFGPPRALEKTLIHGWQRAHWSGDGRWLGVADNRNKNAFILNPDKPGERLFLDSFPNLATIALSADGQWAAIGAVYNSHINIWHVPKKKAVRDFPGYSEAAFSLDGRWLVAGSRDEFCLWRVGTWETVWRLPREQRVDNGFAPAAFSKDGHVLALARSPQRIQLVDPATGREIATLSAPTPSAISGLCFSPDGSRLAVASGPEGAHLWDLRSIRRQLADLGLDWSLPPYAPAKGLDGTQPTQVYVHQDPRTSWRSYWLLRARAHQVFGQPSEAVIDLMEALRILPPDAPPRHRAELLQWRAQNLIRIHGYDAALADLQKAVELAPDSPTACHELARLYVTGPERLRDPREAWRLALQAVNLKPSERTYLSTLALVYYRLALYPQAIETLERGLREQDGVTGGADWFLLAMCRARRGEAAEARDCFARAVQWLQKRQGKLQAQATEEVDALRAEAREVLGSTITGMPSTERPTNPEALSIKVAGHSGPISSVALSSDGKRLLTGSADLTAILWDAESGASLRTFTGHTDIVSSVAMSRHGQQVLTGAFDFTAILWDANSGAKLHTFAGHAREVVSIALSKDGRQALTGSWDQTAILWNVQSGARLQTFAGHSSIVSCVAISQDGRRVLTGSADHTAILWDVESGGILRTFTGHTQPINSVALSEDGQRVLTGSADHTAILWDVQTGARSRTFTGHSDQVFAAVLSRDGRHMLTGSADHTAILWDVETPARLHTFSGHADEVRSVALSDDGRRC